MKHLIRLFFLLIFSLAVGDIVPDQTFPNRIFDEEAMKEYRADPSFDYSSEYAKDGSLITLFIAYLLERFFSIFPSDGVGWLMPWLLRIFVASVILSVLYYILKNRYGSILVGEPRAYGVGGVVTGNDQQVDHNRLIHESRKAGDYKLAIRYLFLMTLNDLGKSGSLKLTSWKAPYDYLRELPAQRKDPFQKLADIFELTWYGDYQADESLYQESSALSDAVRDITEKVK